MAFHEAGKDQPRCGYADLDDSAETELQRSAIAFQIKHRIGGMQEERHTELFDARIKGRQTLGVDPRIAADASGEIHPHQSQLEDRVIQHLDGVFRVGQRYGCARPDAAWIFALRARHRLVPRNGGVTALFGRQVGEIDREGTKRTDHAHLVAKAVHMFELLIEIEPFGPTVQRWAARLSYIIVAAAAIALRTRIGAALAKLLEDASRPPMEMRIDDPHSVYPLICPCSRLSWAAMLTQASIRCQRRVRPSAVVAQRPFSKTSRTSCGRSRRRHLSHRTCVKLDAS